MPYEILEHPAPVGGRITFRCNEPDDDPAAYVRPARLVARGIAFAYIDGGALDSAAALNSLGRQLRTDNRPYDPHPSTGMKGWYRFMDDLETMSEREPGMVIVIDNAASLFADPASWVFELITVWVLQLKGWPLSYRNPIAGGYLVLRGTARSAMVRAIITNARLSCRDIPAQQPDDDDRRLGQRRPTPS